MSNESSSKSAKLVVLSAPSGTGKSTLATMLLERNLNFALSVSYTTRKPRGDEQHGQHYFFVDEAEFERMIKAKEFLEYAHVFGKSWYGTARSTVENFLSNGKNVLFDIDVQGAHQLKTAFQDRCITVFILPPSFSELEQRLKGRKTESPEAIEMRLKTARQEMKAAPSFDYRVTNKDLESAYHDLETILKNEGCL